MKSMIFEVHVEEILRCVDEAMPKLREKFDSSLTLSDVVNTIGTDKLMHEQVQASLSATIASSRDERQQGHWIDIPGLYQEALKKKKDLGYLGENI